MALQWLCPLVPSLSLSFHWICCIMDAMFPVEIISLNDKTISTALLYFHWFCKEKYFNGQAYNHGRNGCTKPIFLSVKHKDRATHTTYLMSCQANTNSAKSYDKKKTKPKSNTLFPSQTEVWMPNIMDPCPTSYSSWTIALFRNWDNWVSSQMYPWYWVVISLCSWISSLY